METTTSSSSAQPIAALRTTTSSSSTKLDAGSTAPLVAAVRPARKAVPAEQLEPQEGEEAQVEQDPQTGGDIIEDQIPRLPDGPPAENSEEQRVTRAKKIPDMVTKEAYDKHMLTHLPFRSWCDHCCAGKVREDSNFKRPDPSGIEVPRVSMGLLLSGQSLRQDEGTRRNHNK